MNLSDYIAKRQSVLVVATGPTRVLANAWRPCFGAVATVQQACTELYGIDYGLFMDWQPTLGCVSAFGRVNQFICPEELLSLDDQNDRRTLEQCGIPRERAITFPVNLHRGDRDKAFECVVKGELYFPWTTGPVMIHALALMGYRSIFCLGHSDMDGTVPPHYQRFRKMCEDTADAIGHHLGCRVRFWKPGDTP